MSKTPKTEVPRCDMPLLSHLAELRRCLITSLIALAIGFGIAFYFYDQLVEFFLVPLQALAESSEGEFLYVNMLVEGFFVRVKISAVSGVIISLPVHVFNILYFIFPGLKTKEKRIIILILAASFILILVSFVYSYYKILPVSITFLTGKGFIPKNTGMLLNFSKNISYVIQLMLATLVVFQMPIVLEMLLVLNICSRKFLLSIGKYIVVLMFVLSAVITPPDCISQIGLALPLIGFYYLAILVAKIFKFGEV